MASFEPSPRESKRRRTGSYATRRTTLSTSPSVRTNERRGASQISAKQNGTETDVPLSVLSNAGEEPGPVATDAITEEAAGATASRRSSGRRKRTTEAASEGLNSVPQGKLTEKTRMAATGRDGAAEPPQEVDEGEDEIQPRSSGRTRRPPRRFVSPSTELPKETPGLEKRSTEKVKSKAKQTRALTSEAANNIQYPQPKGILTPSRHGRERRAGPRKSVVFENDEKQIEEQLGFRDIDSSTKKEKKRVTETKPQRRSKDGTPEQSDGREGSDDEIDAAAVAQLAIGEVSVEDDEDEELLLEETPVLDDILPPTALADSTKTPTTTNDDPHLTTIKLEVLNRMTSHSLSPISHLDTQYTTVHSLLNATITAGESNSLLLLGSRGAGKSLLISHTLSELRKSHGDDFHIVRLNGFFQTDDKLALREIWRQLGHEMAVPEAETGEVSSYADTMASLLSLLSHPEELDDPEGMALDHPNTEQQNKMSKSVIFILDEFDLFTTHPRQTLLYNLFDIAQAKKAPIAVVGCSTRMDVVECLEKRVKSRFSHRWLHVPGMKSVSAFEEAVASVLCLPMEGKEGLGLGEEELKWRRRWNRSIKTRLLPAPTTQAVLKKTFYSTKSLPDLLTALYAPVATISVSSDEENDNIHAGSNEKSSLPYLVATHTSPPSLLSLLPHLPTLHLSLLICAARLETIHDVAVANFALVHKQYTDLLARTKLQRSSLSSLTKGGALTGAGLRSWSKDTVRGAWEELAQWEFILPVSGSGEGRVAGQLGHERFGGDRVETKMFRVDVMLDEIAWALKVGNVGAGEILTKWCKEV